MKGQARESFQPGKTERTGYLRSSDVQVTQSSIVMPVPQQTKAAMKIDITTENKPLKINVDAAEKSSIEAEVELGRSKANTDLDEAFE